MRGLFEGANSTKARSSQGNTVVGGTACCNPT